MSTPFRLQLPRPIYEEMLTHALAELPNECCGLLAGFREGVSSSSAASPPCVQVVRCYPLVNQLASPTEYLSEPRSMFEADRDMRRNQLEVVAVYHSHPTAPPVPSRKDLERNYCPQVVHFIISLTNNKEPTMRGWWLEADGYREAAWEVIDG